jgi:hypothetical protein
VLPANLQTAKQAGRQDLASHKTLRSKLCRSSGTQPYSSKYIMDTYKAGQAGR